MRNRIAPVVLFSLALLLSTCTPPPPEKAKDPVTLQLKWLHQAQFAGFYMAREKGYYAEENLDVTFLEGGQDVNPCERLCNSKADFAIVSAESVFSKHKEDRNVKAVAVIYQRSPVVFAAKAESHIVRPQDFAGKTIAVSNVEGGGFVEALIQFNTLMKKMGLKPSDYRTVPFDPLYQDFLSGKADITTTSLVSGAIMLRNKGIQLNFIWPGDYGIPFYSDTLATTDKYLQEKPDIALRFVRASMRGWQDVVEHADEAVDATLKYVEAKDRTFQHDMVEAQMPLVHTGKQPIGWMEPQIWQSMYQILVEQGISQNPVQNLESVYTLDLLKAVYKAEDK
ncbi:MAG: ABC transporter substrate-binding protein [Desulfoprunum sp.]|nr:ABC transporter substrate-binding protein [Desulfoprunum sp.]